MLIRLRQKNTERIPVEPPGVTQELTSVGMTLLTNGGYPSYALALAERVNYDTPGTLLDAGSPGGLVTFLAYMWGKPALFVHSDLRRHRVVASNFTLNRLGEPGLVPVARIAEVTTAAPAGVDAGPNAVSHVVLPSHLLDVTQALQWIEETALVFPAAELLVLARRHAGRRRISELLESLYHTVLTLWEDDREDAAVFSARDPRDPRDTGSHGGDISRTLERIDSRYAHRHVLGLPGDHELVFRSVPGLFSHRGIDDGSRALVEEVNVDISREGTAVDLGCGYGPVGLSLASLRPRMHWWVLDVDLRALSTAIGNARANGIENVDFAWSDGWSAFSGEEVLPGGRVALRDGHPVIESLATGDSPAQFQLVTTNPPFHEEYSVARTFIEGTHDRLSPGGRIYLAIRRPKWYENKLRSTFGGCRRVLRGEYTVLMAEKRYQY